MERKIGEIFEYNGEWYQIVKSQGKCCSCDFMIDGHCIVDFSSNGSCFYCHRKDKENVIFKKLEKVGEPYDDCGIILQRFKIYTDINITNVDTKGLELHIYSNNTIGIEIKQNKEDMEEYEMHDAKEDIPEFDKVVDECLFGKQELKLKPFDLQKAKEGKPVCTRDGRNTRIICFDFRISDGICMIAAIECGKTETIFYYDLDGKCRGEGNNKYDLMMLPEKRSGWAKVRKDINLYDTKEEADRKMIGNDEYVTAKVCWEE